MEVSIEPGREALDYFGIDIKSAEVGAKRYSEALRTINRKDKRELFESNQKPDELAAFAIGLKPTVMLDDDRDKAFAAEFCNVSSGEAVVINNFLVNKSRAQKTVEENSDVFDDYDGGDIETYLTSVYVSPGENKDLKLGVLLGYPKDASKAFNEYMDQYSSFFRTVYSDIISPASRYDEDIKQFFRNFTYKGTPGDIQRSNKFRDENQTEAFRKIRSLEIFANFSDEEITYIVKARGVQSGGLNYMGMSDSENYTKVPKYAEKVFEISGMNRELDAVKEDLATLDYDTDYELAVDAVSNTVASIFSGHMSWGIMENDPETKIKAELKEIDEGFNGLVELTRQKNPGEGVDKFEKDFGQGFGTIKDAILKAVHDKGGIYMFNSLNKIPKIDGLDWVAKEALEILNYSGFDVGPIIDEIKSGDVTSIKAVDVFKKVFPPHTNL